MNYESWINPPSLENDGLHHSPMVERKKKKKHCNMLKLLYLRIKKILLV